MPFKSEAQRKWMYANRPEMAKRWEKETPKGKKLRKYVKKKTAASKKEIHQLADRLNIPWDDDPKFKRWSKKITGKSCLDAMSPAQLVKIKRALKARGKKKTASSKLRSMIRLTKVKGELLGKGTNPPLHLFKTNPKESIYLVHLGDERIGFVRVGPRGPKGETRIAQSSIDSKYRGMGLGRKVYGEIMRRQPEGKLLSDDSLTSSARRVWESMKKRPGYKIEHRVPAYHAHEGPSYTGQLPPKARIKEKTAASVKGHYRKVPGGGSTHVEAHERKTKKPFARGLPSKKKMTPVPNVPVGRGVMWEFGVQDHHAKRAGRHFDLRLGDPRTGIAHSWAIPKAKLPEPGEKLLAIQQPDHTLDYMSFRGVLKDGYGAGKVDLHKRSKVEIVYASESVVTFNLYEGRQINNYVLRKTRDKSWLLMNVTPTRETRPGLPSSKPKYKETKPEKVDLGREDEIVQAKIDGAHVLVDLQPGKQTRLFSYRPTERSTGIIDHTYRVPGFVGHKALKGTGKTLLRGEVYAIDAKGKALPAQDIGGMLNAGVIKSRDLQSSKGKLTTAVFDVVRYKGKDVENSPYREKLRILREIVGQNRGVMHLPDTAEDQPAKEKLYAAIRDKKHKQTSEGVIVWNRDKPHPPTKAKHRPVFDVHVRKVFPAYGKEKGELNRAGGFEYSWAPSGPIIGKVGTGFSHATLRDMKSNPSTYIGRVAKVRSLEKMRGKGALRAPSFSEWHLDKGK